jgi:DNA-binding transcriptional LysR family regulator
VTTIKILDRESPLKIEWLRSFLAVTDLASFTRAAKTLHLSQPAVSTHIRELEANLETRLFERVGNTIRLTKSGERVARESRRILEDVRELQLAAADSEGAVQGVFRIGASTTPGNYLLPERLAEFERRYPRARAEITIGNSGKIVDLLGVNEVDLGVVGLEPDPREFVSRPFARDEIVVFSSSKHRLARKRKVPMSELAHERFLLREQESATRQVFERWRSGHRVEPEVMVLGCPETVKRAAAAGLGVGILSRHAIEWEVREGRLAELEVPAFPIQRWLYVVHHRSKHLSRGLQALLKILGELRARK